MNSSLKNKNSLLIFFLFITITFSVFNCGTNKLSKSNLTAHSIQFISLEAINISENLTAISTQNDEVFFMINLIQKNGDYFKIKDEIIFAELLFDSLHIQHIVDKQTLQLNDIDYITFSLVELDDYDSHPKVERILKEKINKGIFLERINKTDMDSILSNDDFLGMKYLQRNQIIKGKEIELKISGMQMFDKYDYRIKLKGI